MSNIWYVSAKPISYTQNVGFNACLCFNWSRLYPGLTWIVIWVSKSSRSLMLTHELNKLSRSCHGIFLIFLLPCSTKSFIMMSFSWNCASEVTFVKLDRTVGLLQELSLQQDLDIYFKIIKLLWAFCRDNLQDGFRQIIWEAITITFTLNGGLSVANKQYHRLLLRRSEGMYKFS